MNNILFDLNNIRLEISFKSLNELRSILSFYQQHNLCKVNIPCKNSLNKEFLLNSIKISREEFPNIDIIPHFSILHEFRRTSLKTKKSLNEFLQFVKYLGCNNVLLISGSQKRSSLDSLSALTFLKDNPIFLSGNFSIGVAYNPYLPNFLFNEEIIRLEKKLLSGLVTSIWIQFGTDIKLFESRIGILKSILLSTLKHNPKIFNVKLFGSILVPSKQFLARFKYRPWKGVYCSKEFLDSLDYANNIVKDLLKAYKSNNISPIIETNISSENELNSLRMIL